MHKYEIIQLRRYIFCDGWKFGGQKTTGETAVARMSGILRPAFTNGRMMEVSEFKPDGTCDAKTTDGAWQNINTEDETSFFGNLEHTDTK